MKLQIPSDEKLADFSIQATASGIGEAARTLDDQAMLVFKYSDQSEVEAETQNREVMERYSSVELADEATEALKLEREGRREEAQHRLMASVHRNRPYINSQVAADHQNMSDRMKTG